MLIGESATAMVRTEILAALESHSEVDRIAAELQRHVPEVVEVYLDVTSRPGRQVAASTPDATSASTSDPNTTR